MDLEKRFCDECLCKRFIEHVHFIDPVCGQTFGQCARGSCTHRGAQPKTLEGHRKDIRKLFVEFSKRFVLTPPEKGGDDYIFGTLSFGCTFCGEKEHARTHQYDPHLRGSHVYRSPGRQNARKKLETFLDDIAPPVFKIDTLRHCEEFGKETGRIHFHFFCNYRGVVDMRVRRSIAHRWSMSMDRNGEAIGYGFARIERLLSEEGMEYIDKTFGYVSKGEVDEMVITPISFVDMVARGDANVWRWNNYQPQLVEELD